MELIAHNLAPIMFVGLIIFLLMGVDFRAILTPVFHPMLTPPFGA